MSKAKARVFVPLTKVDEEKRLVFGTITQEILDKSGEVMDYESSKPNFEKWSGEIEAATGGLSKGNLRVMHGLTVAGKVTDIAFNDNDKSIEVCAKVVDDTEWNKVVEGCYTGFSVGGKYGKKWKEEIDGQTIQKFTAVPNEVSLVDNPCLPSATFSLVKADGVEEAVMFKVAEAQQRSEEAPEEEAPKQAEVRKEAPVVEGVEPSNAEVANRATELAKQAGHDNWAAFIDQARQELIKEASASPDKEELTEEAEESDDTKGTKKKKEASAEEAKEGEESEDDTAEKVTPPGVRQKWTTSDGQAFEKKADAIAHESQLQAPPKTEAELLAERLNKAMDPDAEVEQLPLEEDFERLGKVFDALSTPLDSEDLKKGLYTASTFGRLLHDMVALGRSIAAEGAVEGNDSSDTEVAKSIKEAATNLAASFKIYAADQVDELLAGMDDDCYISYYDYYAAAKNDGLNKVAEDVCAIMEDRRELTRDKRETLAKAFGVTDEPEDNGLADEVADLRKRFDAVSAEKDELAKVAKEAVDKVEDLAKRLKAVEDTPLPRALNATNIALREGDGQFLGKVAKTDEQKVEILHDFIKQHGPEGAAVELIKAAQASGGRQMHINR